MVTADVVVHVKLLDHNTQDPNHGDLALRSNDLHVAFHSVAVIQFQANEFFHERFQPPFMLHQNLSGNFVRCTAFCLVAFINSFSS